MGTIIKETKKDCTNKNKGTINNKKNKKTLIVRTRKHPGCFLFDDFFIEHPEVK